MPISRTAKTACSSIQSSMGLVNLRPCSSRGASSGAVSLAAAVAKGNGRWQQEGAGQKAFGSSRGGSSGAVSLAGRWKEQGMGVGH